MKLNDLKSLIKEAIEEVTFKSDFSEYSDDALTDMIVNLSREEPKDEKAIQGVKDELAKRKGDLKEGELVESFEPETDDIGAFWVVEKPTTNAELNDICFECNNVVEFARLVKGGLNESDIKGIFTKEPKAKKLAEKLLAERDKKKDEVKVAADAYKKMKEETLAKVSEYMKNKKVTKAVVDELKDVTK